MEGTRLDTLLCHQCRGRCCLGHPGVWSDPQRFFDIFTTNAAPAAEKLASLLTTQDIELRNLGGVLIPAPQATEQGCIALKGTGCSYSTTERPCQCLALTPELETLLDDQIHCTMPAAFGSGTARENWRPYQGLLQQAQLFRTESGPYKPPGNCQKS